MGRCDRGVRQGRERCAGLKQIGVGGGGGGGGYGACEEVQEAEGSSPFFGKFLFSKNFRYRGRIFATLAKRLFLHQLCSFRIKKKQK